MTLEEYAYLAEIIGVVLIIASLIYVARQLHQNTDAQLATSRQSLLEADLDLFSKSMDYPGASRGLGNTADEVRLASWLIAYLRIREFAWFQYKSGIMDEDAWISSLSPLSRILRQEQAKLMWENASLEIDPEFVAYLNQILSNEEHL